MSTPNRDALEATAANIRKIFIPGRTKLVAVSKTTGEKVPVCYSDGNRSASWKLCDSTGDPMVLIASK